MEVTRISWIGVKTNSSEEFKKMTRIFSKILHGWESSAGNDYMHFSNGSTMIEVYYENSKRDEIVCGLEVESIENAISEIKEMGLTLIGSKECADGSCWQHFIMPDATEWEVKQSGRD
ncbi:MAG: hypothetical protein QXO03_03600 [Thermoplasmatales archaeon]